MKKKIIFSAGGTGGHLFPAQAVAASLKGKANLLFVGGGLSKNPYFDRSEFEFVEIPTATLNLRSPKKLLFSCLKIAQGFFKSRKIIKTYRPDIVVGFGSFYTFPLLLAALTKKIPIVLHEQNAIPGKVNRLFSKRAKFTAVTFSQSQKHLSGKSVEVVFPLRFPMIRKEKKASLSYFGLFSNKITLLAFGGSQGGFGINRLMKEVAPFLPKEFQILHFTGKKGEAEEIAKLYRDLGLSFCVREFENNMNEAWNVADCAFTRAGASTITEAISWEVPAILIPFPFAAENHQEKNAEHFVKEVKGGFMFSEKSAKSSEIKNAFDKLLSGDFKENIIQYKKEKKLQKFEDLIIGEF